MSPRAAQGLIRFLDDLVASGQPWTPVECGPFVEPLTPHEQERLDAFRANAVGNDYPAIDTRDRTLGIVHCVAYVPSRQVLS